MISLKYSSVRYKIDTLLLIEIDPFLFDYKVIMIIHQAAGEAKPVAA